jgi:nitrite reductase/ring-hydroxylating ferredoxin subunit
MAFTSVAAAADLAAGTLKKFDLEGLEITVANVEGNFYAFEDRCPHMNSPLHQGKLEGREVVCPMHKARFDVTTGRNTAAPRIPIPKALKVGWMMANIRTHDLILHAVKVENGDLLVDR